MRDRWGYDRDTGVKGLECGHRRVKNGKVKIGHERWAAIPGRGSLAAYEGKTVEVAVYDRLSTIYMARDPETLQAVAFLAVVNTKPQFPASESEGSFMSQHVPPADAGMYRCTNPDCRALHATDPQGHCPVCKQPDGSGWSCVPEPPPDCGSEAVSKWTRGQNIIC